MPFPTLIVAGLVLIGVAQLFVVLAAVVFIKRGTEDRRKLARHLRRTLERVELLTMRDRNEFVRHYDQMLERLSNKLPAIVASRTGDAIFEMEKKVLAQLASLDPSFAASDARADDLIRSMEALEDAVIATVASTVRDSLVESKERVFRDFRAADISEGAALTKTVSGETRVLYKRIAND